MSNASSGTQRRRRRSVWNAPGGRYDEISRSIADAIEHAVERLQPERGRARARPRHRHRLGVAHHRAALPGRPVVTGVDIADEMLEYARASGREAASSPSSIATATPRSSRSRAGELDAVVSTFGVMFASKPEAAAAELARVVKRGGRVVLATWKHDGNVANMFGVMKPFMAAACRSRRRRRRSRGAG